MKVILICIAVFTITSCSKCKICDYIVEDNYSSARNKCLGAASLYPSGFRELSRVEGVEFCNGSDYETGVIDSKTFCDGVTGTVVAKLNCR